MVLGVSGNFSEYLRISGVCFDDFSLLTALPALLTRCPVPPGADHLQGVHLWVGSLPSAQQIFGSLHGDGGLMAKHAGWETDVFSRVWVGQDL